MRSLYIVTLYQFERLGESSSGRSGGLHGDGAVAHLVAHELEVDRTCLIV